MAQDNPSPKPPAPRRSTPWSRAGSSPGRPNRLAFRLVGIPVLAVAGVLLYRGLHDYFVLPECDSSRARDTLADVLKQLKLEPLRYDPRTTVSTRKDEVVCRAALPLADGANVYVDYGFFWQGAKATMKYSISRRPLENAPPAPPMPPRAS
ncbi:MAG: hypothetical protein P4L80_07905 [Xanthobacteraceae bacterium]|nr:hypothetical protein [Xanthobacteraceae bacterium]